MADKDKENGERIRRVAGQYAAGDLRERVLARLAEHGLGPDRLSREDIAAMDELHVGGGEATRELADIAEIRRGWRVLDIGAGVGGPARTLAAEFGCEVVGLDLTEEYCAIGRLLSEWVGMGDEVAFVCGSATALPFGGGVFDAVWLQFVGMNVHDKGGMIGEIRRVLRRGGKLVLHEVLQGSGEALVYPVFWADEGSLSHLVTPSELARLLEEGGFVEKRFEDVSGEALAWYGEVRRKPAPSAGSPAPINLGVLVGREAGRKSRNVETNLESGRIRIYRGVFERV